MDRYTILASGLQGPEGPVAFRDGSLGYVEILSNHVCRLDSDLERSVIGTASGANGLAVGPDDAWYVCANGGVRWANGNATQLARGHIQRIDPATGKSDILYTHCNSNRLSAPNDLVFDKTGGFYFTDSGARWERARDNGGVYYAQADGTDIVEIVYPMLNANGIGLSPDQKTLYVAETEGCRLWAFDIFSPGRLAKLPGNPYGGRLVAGLDGFQWFDSLAVEENGNICVATLISGCITVVSPEGDILSRVKVPDDYPTNICFGGNGMHTAYVTLAETGRLIAMPWPRAGLRLNHA